MRPPPQRSPWLRFLRTLAGAVLAGWLTGLLFASRDLLLEQYLLKGQGRLALDVLAARLIRGVLLGAVGGLLLAGLDLLSGRLAGQVRQQGPRRVEPYPTLAAAALLVLGVLVYDLAFWQDLIGASRASVRLLAWYETRSLARVAAVPVVAATAAAGLLLVIRRLRPIREPTAASGRFPNRALITGGVLAALSTLLLGGWQIGVLAAGAREAPNLVLITVDTLRADELGVYGSPEAVTPEIDRLGRQGVAYRRAISQASWTLPAMATLLTGLHPSRHGAVHADTRIAPGVDALAELLRQQGYRTLGVVSHYFVSRRFGFAQGFHRFDQEVILEPDGVSSERITDAALRLLGGTPRQPFFLWIHYLDPHYDYVGHPRFGIADVTTPYRSRYSIEKLRVRAQSIGPEETGHVRDLYREEIAFTDEQIGRLLAGVEERSGDRPTVVALTADHGEAFRERGRFGHGEEVWPELVHVPLILAGDLPAELRGQSVDAPVETRAVFATLLELAGIGVPREAGPGLLELASAAASAGPTGPCFTEGSLAFEPGRMTAAVILGRWKLVRRTADGSEELYDLESDPAELDDLMVPAGNAAHAPLAELRELLDRYLAVETAPRVELELTAAELDHLRSLGYVR